MRLELINFHPAHLDIVLAGHEELAKKKHFLSGEAVIGRTLIADGAPVICGGIITNYNGVGEVWLVKNPVVFPRYKFTAIKVVKQYLIDFADYYNLHRLQATDEGDEQNGKWLTFLGFKKESTMKMYKHDKTNINLYTKF